MTDLNASMIAHYKEELADLDVKVFKYIEGILSQTEFESVCKRKQEIRAEINRLEAGTE